MLMQTKVYLFRSNMNELGGRNSVRALRSRYQPAKYSEDIESSDLEDSDVLTFLTWLKKRCLDQK